MLENSLFIRVFLMNQKDSRENVIKAFFLLDNKTGCRFVIVDAYRSAIPFYEKNGFLPLLAEDDGGMTCLLYFDLVDYQENFNK